MLNQLSCRSFPCLGPHKTKPHTHTITYASCQSKGLFLQNLLHHQQQAAAAECADAITVHRLK
jgi:hypothetical protein